VVINLTVGEWIRNLDDEADCYTEEEIRQFEAAYYREQYDEHYGSGAKRPLEPVTVHDWASEGF
jgi:hypothetical protein